MCFPWFSQVFPCYSHGEPTGQPACSAFLASPRSSVLRFRASKVRISFRIKYWSIDIPVIYHEKSMKNSWKIHEKSMKNPWNAYLKIASLANSWWECSTRFNSSWIFMNYHELLDYVMNFATNWCWLPKKLIDPSCFSPSPATLEAPWLLEAVGRHP